MEKIFVTRTSLPPFEEYCAEIRELWDSALITNMGVKHQQLQKELEVLLQGPLTLFANGHLALEGMLEAMDLPRGGEVITSPFTFVSTTHALVRKGLVPVFCDVLEEDGTLDPEKAEALITERTVAILPIHVYGHPCQVEKLEELSRRHGLKLLYDAAHAFDVQYKDVPLVRYGDASILSFHATKVFSTIEGGAVCYSDKALRQRLEDLTNFGIRDYESCPQVGGNAKMNEFQAAMGLCNLRHVDAAKKPPWPTGSSSPPPSVSWNPAPEPGPTTRTVRSFSPPAPSGTGCTKPWAGKTSTAGSTSTL